MTYSEEIIVTGAGGTVGSAICDYLQNMGLNVMAIYRTEPIVKLPWRYLVIDLEENNSYQSFGSLSSIKALIHAAAVIPSFTNNDDDCFERNRRIDKNILKVLSAKPDINFIFISSTNLYGISNSVVSEQSELDITNKYADAKFISENEFLDKHHKTTILRINAPYSPLQKSNTVLKIFIDRVKRNLDIFYHGSGRRQQDFTHVKDIALAVWLCLTKPVNGIFNISTGEPIAMRDLGELIISSFPNTTSRLIASGEIDNQENYKAFYNCDKARVLLGWKPNYTLAKGVKEWIKAIDK